MYGWLEGIPFIYFFPRQFNSSVRSDGREGDNEIYLIVDGHNQWKMEMKRHY